MARPLRILLVAATAAAALASAAAPAWADLSTAPDAPGYTVAGGFAEVRAVLRVGDTIYIGGNFGSVNGATRNNLAAINASNGLLTSWAPAINGEVYALAAAGNTIYVGGQFVTAGPAATARNGAAAFDASGSLLAWDPHPDNADVEALVVAGSRAFLGGSFTTTNNGASATPNLAAVDLTSGTADLTYPSADGFVDGLVQDGTYVYPAGYYLNLGASARDGLGAVKISDGSIDAFWDPSEPGSNGGSINAIALSPDRSTIYVTGDFFVNLPPGVSMGHADRYKAAGLEPAGDRRIGNATSFDPRPDTEGSALAVTSSGVYYGSSIGAPTFNWSGGFYARSELSALDPVTGQPQAWDPSPAGDVFGLAAGADGSVYAGGQFTAMAQPPAAVGFASFSLPPANTGAPAVTGTPQPGQTLTCDKGTWSGATPQSYGYLFLRDGSGGGPPSTTGTYTVANGDVGHTISCKVIATNRVSSVSADSAPVTIEAVPAGPAGPTGPTGPSGPPPPVLLRSVNVVPVGGTVKVKLPGATSFILIQDARNVPVGTIVDVTRGTVEVVSAKDARGGTQTGTFYGGLFKIVQLKGNPPITELILVGGNFKLCKARAASVVVAAGKRSSRTIRHLWGNATGAFRTKGRYASATIRGTKWLTADRCDGTLIRVAKGAVTVRDLVKRKSVIRRAGHSYLALARKH